jgi:hypothetical protein
MFDRLFHLFSRRRNTGPEGSIGKELPARSLPTPGTISRWDDQSLFAALGCESALRYHRDGFESLNEAERSLCCFYLLESDVNNGGFGQWIDSLCPRSAAETPRILREIGAMEMATLVTAALQQLGDATGMRSRDEWGKHYLSMPDNVHEHWETLSPQFLQLEGRFLELAYRYARDHWKDVRAA